MKLLAISVFTSQALAFSDLAKRDGANPYLSCETTGDNSEYACRLNSAPTANVIVHFSLPPNSVGNDNRAITLSSCAFTFTPTNYAAPQILYVNVPLLLGNTAGQVAFNFLYDIEAPTMNYHKCSGQFSGTRAFNAIVAVPPTYCGVSGDPHVFMFSQYTSASHFGDGFSTQAGNAGGPVGITIPAFLTGTFWLLKSTMGLQIQVKYDGDCLQGNFDSYFKDIGLIPSCVSALYIQYLDQAFIITLKKGENGPDTDSLLQSYVGPANGNLLTQTSENNNRLIVVTVADGPNMGGSIGGSKIQIVPQYFNGGSAKYLAVFIVPSNVHYQKVSGHCNYWDATVPQPPQGSLTFFYNGKYETIAISGDSKVDSVAVKGFASSFLVDPAMNGFTLSTTPPYVLASPPGQSAGVLGATQTCSSKANFSANCVLAANDQPLCNCVLPVIAITTSTIVPTIAVTTNIVLSTPSSIMLPTTTQELSPVAIETTTPIVTHLTTSVLSSLATLLPLTTSELSPVAIAFTSTTSVISILTQSSTIPALIIPTTVSTLITTSELSPVTFAPIPSTTTIPNAYTSTVKPCNKFPTYTPMPEVKPESIAPYPPAKSYTPPADYSTQYSAAKLSCLDYFGFTKSLISFFPCGKYLDACADDYLTCGKKHIFTESHRVNMQSELDIFNQIVIQSNNTSPEFKAALQKEATNLGVGANIVCPNNCTSSANGQCSQVGCICSPSFGKKDCSMQLEAKVPTRSWSSNYMVNLLFVLMPVALIL